jgi:hypothetical protein
MSPNGSGIKGYSVRFFDPRSPISPAQIDELSLVVNKQVFPVTHPALRYARQTETPLWNNLTATILFSSRLIALHALEEVGFHVPPVTFENPDGEYVAKSNYVWEGEPELNGTGDFYQELVPTEPVDYKYYAVTDGEQIYTGGRRVTSKLYSPKRYLGPARVKPTLTACLRRLIERTDIRGLGVDCIKGPSDRFWAVDLNLAAGYRNTGLELPLCKSIQSRLPD